MGVGQHEFHVWFWCVSESVQQTPSFLKNVFIPAKNCRMNLGGFSHQNFDNLVSQNFKKKDLTCACTSGGGSDLVRRLCHNEQSLTTRVIDF